MIGGHSPLGVRNVLTYPKLILFFVYSCPEISEENSISKIIFFFIKSDCQDYNINDNATMERLF